MGAMSLKLVAGGRLQRPAVKRDKLGSLLAAIDLIATVE
jgi:hypothetical protein